jgi:hypothetical protein
MAGLAQSGLRIAYSRQCPYALYDTHTCKAAKAPVAATVTALTANTVQASSFLGFADHVLAGGMLTWRVVGTVFEQRAILDNVGGVVTLLSSTFGMEIGMSVNTLIGCPRTRAGCNSLHDNLANYGGFAHMPGKSPFDGTPVF